MINSHNLFTDCTISYRDISAAIANINLEGILTSTIKKVIFNPPATIIMWGDGTKTVVKAMKGVEFNPYYGFTAAVTKKVFGYNSRVSKLVKHGEWWPRPKPARTESLNCKEEK